MSEIKLVFPRNNARISFATDAQIDFFKDQKRFIEHEQELKPREIDLSIGGTVSFQWKPAVSGIVQIAQEENFTFCEEFPGINGSAPVYNLPYGKTYFARIKIGDGYSPVTTFSVNADTPRWIYMPNVTNVRDLGLWKTQDGKRIKQGMIFRGAKLDFNIGAKGIHAFKNQLGIRTELDLRGQLEGCRTVEVEHYYKIPMSAYATWGTEGIFTDEQKEKVRLIFDILADESSYPLYFHCAGGGDRTGTIAFLLEALLGLDEETMTTEYELSNLSVSGERTRFTEVWRSFMKKLETFAPGDTRQNQVIAYLKSCAVTTETLTKIHSILLESA